MKVTYDKNECGYKCMVEYQQREHGCTSTYRGVTFERHPTKKLAKDEAVKNVEKVMF